MKKLFKRRTFIEDNGLQTLQYKNCSSKDQILWPEEPMGFRGENEFKAGIY